MKPSECPKTEGKAHEPEIEMVSIRDWEDFYRHVRSLEEVDAGDCIYDSSAFIEEINKTRMEIFSNPPQYEILSSWLSGISESFMILFLGLMLDDLVAEREWKKYTENKFNRIRVNKVLVMIKTNSHAAQSLPSSDPPAPKKTENG